MATISVALHVPSAPSVQAHKKLVHVTLGANIITITREEAAHLAADLLDAIGAKSCEVVDMDNALPPVLERAIRRGEGA